MRRLFCWLALLAAEQQQQPCDTFALASASGLTSRTPASSRGSDLHRVPHRLEQDAAFLIGANLTNATRDIVAGLPVDRVTLVFDGTVDARFRRMLTVSLHLAGILTLTYGIDTQKQLDEYIAMVRQTMSKYEGITSIIFCSRKSSEKLISAIRNANLIQRNILYMFYYELWPPSESFVGALQEAMRVAVISNPRPGTYRIYYTQATPEGGGTLKLVNWWSSGTTLFRYPVLPPASRIYTDLRGRTLLVPVLHKPPWNFVTYTNKTFLVGGGRDHELLLLLAEKLHFNFEYFDPPERSQGSAFVETADHNKTFPGIIGLISERRADLALGDITITFERSQAVEFSFLTLADSGAFVTRTPSRLNEALALVRPFQMEVWPVLVLTILLTGPLLFGVLEAPRLWRGKAWMQKRGRRRISDKKLFGNAVWFSIALFFKQSVRGPEDSHRVRLLTILLSFAATYVIGDMYSANLTSLLARPGRERPISNLEQLADAMETRGYQLLVEKHSSSYNVLENGTGLYERLWRLMLRQREVAEVASGEDGMIRVGREPNLAMLGGRETLYFDTRRFGAHRFHLSEKLYTRYSAIALQIGCPYVESINNILMQLFEAGILTKMTEEEYEKLGDKLHDQGPELPERADGADSQDAEPGQDDAEAGDDEEGSATELPPTDYSYYQENYYDDYRQPEDYGVPDCCEVKLGLPEGEPISTAPTETSTSTPSTTTPAVALRPVDPEGPAEGSDREVKKGRSTASSDETLKPISIKMLQGAFYALLAGYLLAAVAFWLELASKRLEHYDCTCSCYAATRGWAERPWARRLVRACACCRCCCSGVPQVRQRVRDAAAAALLMLRASTASSDDDDDEVEEEAGVSKRAALIRPTTHEYLRAFLRGGPEPLPPPTLLCRSSSQSSSSSSSSSSESESAVPSWSQRQTASNAFETHARVSRFKSSARPFSSCPSTDGSSISCIRPFIN